MRAIVTRFRERGKRRSDHDFNNDAGVFGELRLATVGCVIQLNVSAPGDQQLTPLIPTLYEAELVSMHHGGMLFRGFETIGGAGYVQEWRAIVEGQ